MPEQAWARRYSRIVSEAELFVVCKNCGSEVSPYVTECPYCGQRVRKRAPKIPARGEETQAPKRRRTPTLPRLRRDEIPGIAPETRPYATGVLVTCSVVVTILWGANVIGFRNLGVVTGPIHNDWWRLLSTTFIHDNVGVIFATMLATAIFGTHLERRFGPALVVGTFLLGGAAGAALAVAFKDFPAVGANASALALLVAWLVDDRLAAQRGEERGNDMIGLAVIAAVLLALPLADTNVSWAASIGGIGLGAAVGALISPLRR